MAQEAELTDLSNAIMNRVMANHFPLSTRWMLITGRLFIIALMLLRVSLGN
jgi:hypothetical protein